MENLISFPINPNCLTRGAPTQACQRRRARSAADVQQQAGFQMACVAMITTDDLSDGDVHFTAAAYDVIGARFAEALFSLDCK